MGEQNGDAAAPESETRGTRPAQFSVRALLGFAVVAAFYALLAAKADLHELAPLETALNLWLLWVVVSVTALCYATGRACVYGMVVGTMVPSLLGWQSFFDVWVSGGLWNALWYAAFVVCHGAAIGGGVDAVGRGFRWVGGTVVGLTTFSAVFLVLLFA